ncbi:MAG: formate dehydrogenase subunit alpha [Ferroplasma sp.]
MKSICPFCGVGCGLELSAVNGIVTSSKPVEEHVFSHGHICGKGVMAFEALTSWDRMAYPLVRQKDKLDRTDWDNALNITINKIRAIQKQYGNDSVAFYGGCQNTIEEGFLMQKLARALGTNNVDSCARVCHDPSAKALKDMVGIGAGANSVTEVPKADVVIIAGESITDSHPVLSQYFISAKENGTKIVVIDPRATRSDSFGDMHLKIKPRTDIFLFNSIGNYIIKNGLANNEFINNRTHHFDEYKKVVEKYSVEMASEKTGINTDDIIKLANLIASRKTIFSWGLGLTQSTGTAGIKSYIDLALLTGNIGKEGAGLIAYRGQTNVQSSGDLIKPDIYPIGPINEENSKALEKLWGFRPPLCKGTSIPQAFYGGDGKIKAMFLMGYNPVRSLPDKARVEKFLKSLDFLVVQDIYMTESAEYADVVLPAAAWAEKEGSVTSLDRLVKWRYKAVDPPGEAKPDYEILALLAKKAGFGFNSNPEKTFEDVKMVSKVYSKLNIEDVKDYSKNSRYPNGERHLYSDSFSLPDGKANFMPVESPEVPDGLILITGRTVTRYNTDEVINRIPGIQKYEPRLWVNPADASKYGIQDGKNVYIKSSAGELKIMAKITDDVLPGTVFAYMHNPDINYVVTAELDEETGTPKYKFTLVTVTAA